MMPYRNPLAAPQETTGVVRGACEAHFYYTDPVLGYGYWDDDPTHIVQAPDDGIYGRRRVCAGDIMPPVVPVPAGATQLRGCCPALLGDYASDIPVTFDVPASGGCNDGIPTMMMLLAYWGAIGFVATGKFSAASFAGSSIASLAASAATWGMQPSKFTGWVVPGIAGFFGARYAQRRLGRRSSRR